MLKAAGVLNLAEEFDIEFGGFIPLEQLIASAPDIIIFDDRSPEIESQDRMTERLVLFLRELSSHLAHCVPLPFAKNL